jgi:protocatechuate 3,4-dioxygenase beta subunit
MPRRSPFCSARTVAALAAVLAAVLVAPMAPAFATTQPTPSATPTATPSATPTPPATQSPVNTPTSAPTQPANGPINATSLTGRVTDQATGEPIAGASVYIYTSTGKYGTAIPITSTDADGNYTFHSLDVRSYTLNFIASGYRAEWWGGAAEQDDADTFPVALGEAVTDKNATMLPLNSISGTVTAGSPAEGLDGATVSAFDADGIVQGTATTTNGGYAIADLEPGAYSLRFAPPAQSELVAEWWRDQTHPNTAATVQLKADTAVTGKNAALAAGAEISGRVTDDATGAAISGAWVYAYVSTATTESGRFGGSIASARTNARGDYSFTGLTAGRYTLQFSGGSGHGSAGYLREWWGNKPSRSGATAFALKAGNSMTEADAALVPTASITGTVFAADARNVGLNRATVSAVDTDGQVTRTATTNGMGEYTLTGLKPGRYLLRFDGPAGTSFASTWLYDSAKPTTREVIRVSAGQVVTGKTAELATAKTD